MSSPLPPSHQFTPSEGWVFVESSHTKSRSPQLKVDNMPSRQVANASASASSSIVLPFSEPEPINTTTTPAAVSAPYHPNHIPPSNGGDSASTETAGTDDTTTPLKPAITTPYYYHHYPLTEPADPTPIPQPPQLTHTNMTLHQRELAHHWTGSLAGWVDGAGAGVVGTRHQGRYEESAAAYSSMATVGGGGGASSGSSVAGMEWVPVPSQEGGEELFGTGAWAW